VTPAPLSWRLAGYRLRFSTRADGDLGDATRRRAWLVGLAARRWLVPRQVHGALVADAERDDSEQLLRAAGVVSGDPACGLAVLGADCPGLALLAGDAFALAHCGWRGCAAGMVDALVAALASRSAEPPAAWRALLGPGISGARYQVDAPVLAARSWPAAALSASDGQHAQLDLAAALREDLSRRGVEQVWASGVCTYDDPRLHSYRRDGRGCSQLLALWRESHAAAPPATRP